MTKKSGILNRTWTTLLCGSIFLSLNSAPAHSALLGPMIAISPLANVDIVDPAAHAHETATFWTGIGMMATGITAIVVGVHLPSTAMWIGGIVLSVSDSDLADQLGNQLSLDQPEAVELARLLVEKKERADFEITSNGHLAVSLPAEAVRSVMRNGAYSDAQTDRVVAALGPLEN